MEKIEIISFILGALVLFSGVLIQPYLQRLVNVLKRILTYFKPKPHKVATNDCDAIKTQLDGLEKFVKQKEYNHRAFIRREVKNYLEELKNG
jgi:hypothetical protein